jgi:hypothetical protein
MDAAASTCRPAMSVLLASVSVVIPAALAVLGADLAAVPVPAEVPPAALVVVPDAEPEDDDVADEVSLEWGSVSIDAVGEESAVSSPVLCSGTCSASGRRR